MEMGLTILAIMLLLFNWLQIADRKKLRQERDIYKLKCNVTHTEVFLFERKKGVKA